jgi:hypothetical protein
MQGGGSLSHVILVSQGFDEQEEECPAEKNLTNYESKFGDLCLFYFTFSFCAAPMIYAASYEQRRLSFAATFQRIEI